MLIVDHLQNYLFKFSLFFLLLLPCIGHSSESTENRNPFSSLIKEKNTLSKSSNLSPKKTNPLTRPRLKGVVFSNSGKYAILQEGKLRFIVMEGELFGEKKLLKVKFDKILIQENTKKYWIKLIL